MQYLPQFLTVVVVHLLAVMTPGPDFLMISRNTLRYSRRTGVLSAVGLGLGILVHCTYSMIGIAYIISQSLLLFSILKLACAAYLLYLGIGAIKSAHEESPVNVEHVNEELSTGAALRIGFLTNVLNPKASLFFFALFTQVIHPTTPRTIQTLYGLEMSVMTFLWFSLVATLMSHRQVKKAYFSARPWIERLFGGLLIALGIRVALASAK